MPVRKPTAAKVHHLKVVDGGGERLTRAVAQAQEPNKYAAIFEFASDAIMTARLAPNGTDYIIDEVNRAGEELVGFVKEEIERKPVECLVPAGKIPARSRAFSADLLKVSGTYEDVAIGRQDGYVSLVELSVRVVDESNGFVVALFRDVTEKKRMERELITKHSELRNAYVELEKRNAELKATQNTLVQAGKLAALGELAAGIAHELNQPLMSIRGYTQEMQFLIEEDIQGKECEAEVKVSMKEIISNADKMAKIISHLRTFTRKSTEDFEKVDLRHPIEDALKMVNRQLTARGIDVERIYSPDTPTVYANPLQLEQVFINLTTNARDAIEATGRGQGKIRICTRRAGKFAEITYEDDGCGMNDRSVSKAFNPFFTTKEVGKGMGLGLSLSHGMITKVHGSIRIESEVGKGTKFIIQLPEDFRELG